MPLKNGYCRLCWLQAAALAADPLIVTEDDLARVTYHQLWFAGMTKMRGPRSGVRLRARVRARIAALPSSEPETVTSGQLQLHLPGAGRVFDRAQHAELTSPALVRARRIARALGEGRGWNTKLAAELDRALVILLSGHGDGEQFRYSDLIGVLHRYGVSINRVAEVLTELGLLVDDRVPSFDTWLESKLADLTPGIAADARNWALVLQRGGPRSRPRNINTVRIYVRAAHPVLVEWSGRYDHLREVTSGDVRAVAGALHGHQRRRTLGALRSLTRHCKKKGTIFVDPAARVRPGHRDEPIIIPLRGSQIDEATKAATTPAARIALALAAVHAARPEAIRTLRLDDVDLGNRRLTIGTVTRPLDELTHRLLLDWLEYRRKRWPNTANPHLIINKQTASTTRAISVNALTAPFRQRAATLETLRVDRQLDEALIHGPDPLHLAVVFGLDETTAIRYCAAARVILETPAEQYDPLG
ncbi:site-specific integrase [Nocardia miyunensis]|uniref:site-specific integrase n=1 Tax=Nocardia miyunensis TaxID=282684 RepID=UPI00082FAA3B|nr:site-specific integrase [Nocardia miyunensis]